MNLIDEYIEKLKSLGVYEQFVANTNTSFYSRIGGFEHYVEYMKKYVRDTYKIGFDDFVVNAFSWELSPEGLEFWNEISYK